MNLPGSGKYRSAGHTAFRIALIYAVIALAYILGSDLFLQTILSEATIKRLSHFQMAKGAWFVLITAMLLFYLIRNAVIQIHLSQLAMHQSEDRFRRLVEFSPNGIFIHVGGRFLYANNAMAHILGYDDPTELIGKDNLGLIHPDDQAMVRGRMQIISEKRQPVGLQEQRMLRKDGSYIWVEVAAIPFDVDGKPGTQVMVLDISARKKAQEELRQLNETLEKRVVQRTTELQQALEDLRTFSYMISHDLRTPLGSISRFAQEALESSGVQDNPAGQDAARRIVAISARLDRLIVDLLEYNQLPRSEIQLQRLSPVLLMHEAIGQLRRDPQYANVQAEVREPMPWVRTHRATLALVLQNLLQNAVKYVPNGVTPLITISAEDRGTVARLVIEDNGVGIEPAKLDALLRLQEPSQLGCDGAGIGLVIVRRGVERLGGRIGVESMPGTGSRFWIELPRDPDSP